MTSFTASAAGMLTEEERRHADRLAELDELGEFPSMTAMLAQRMRSRAAAPEPPLTEEERRHADRLAELDAVLDIPPTTAVPAQRVRARSTAAEPQMEVDIRHGEPSAAGGAMTMGRSGAPDERATSRRGPSGRGRSLRLASSGARPFPRFASHP